jgi:Holliday junction resolvase RusA-like endonuclease
MMNLVFFAPCAIAGQPRTKARAVAKPGRKPFAQIYTPKTAEPFRAAISLSFEGAVQRAGISKWPVYSGPVELLLVGVVARNKTHFGKRGNLLPSAPLHHTGTPDADNFAKAVMDQLSELRAWRDDTQVIRPIVTRRYVRGPEDRPGCHVRIAAADEEQTS